MAWLISIFLSHRVIHFRNALQYGATPAHPDSSQALENGQRDVRWAPTRKSRGQRLRDRLLHVGFAKSAGWTEGSKLYPKAHCGGCGSRAQLPGVNSLFPPQPFPPEEA
jgi:hypothetical protein